MKKPQTIGEIIKYFEGLTFRGVDLSLSLSNSFTIPYLFDTLSVRERNDWLYRIARFAPLFFINALRHYSRRELAIPQADVLLLSTGVFRNTLLTFPVLEQLAPLTRLIVYTLSSVEKETRGIPFIRLVDVPFSLKEWRKIIQSYKEDLEKRLIRFQKDFDLSQPIIYSTYSTLCWSIAMVLRAEYLLKKTSPQLIFTDMDRQSNDAIILQVARKMGIPSVTMVHGVRGGDSFLSSVWTPLIADKVIVWGEWMRQDFIKLGVPDNQIIIGGYPRIRPFGQEDRKRANELLDAQDCPKGKRIVVFLSNTSLTEEKPMVEMFMNAQSLAPEWYFMVRPHPQEQLAWYHSHLSDGLLRVQDPRRWSLLHSLSVADVVVGAASSACIDAILMGTPLILVRDPKLDFGDSPMLKGAIDRGIATVAENAEELVKLLLRHPDRDIQSEKVVAKEYATCLGDEAAQLTSGLLRKIIHTQLLD